MTTPDWLKPGLYGALTGAILVAALGLADAYIYLHLVRAVNICGVFSLF